MTRSGSVAPAVLLVVAMIASLVGIGCSEDDATVQWQLIWEDEFDGPAGQLPDASNWAFDLGVDWGNAQLEYDTNRPENVSLDGNGRLAIVARRESYTGPAGTREYTSGRINTFDLFEPSGGRFEARIKLPRGQGLWPAFWMLGADFATVGWPACGEIDIMEYRGQEPGIIFGSLHGPGYSGGGAITGRLDTGLDLSADFHVYAVEWLEDRITWLLDGTPYQTFTRGNLPSGARWVFDHPFALILNVAVGGNFVGSPDASTPFPQTMLVDWVRAYGWSGASGIKP
jgi:beta-glucanase (GH16 family)